MGGIERSTRLEQVGTSDRKRNTDIESDSNKAVLARWNAESEVNKFSGGKRISTKRDCRKKIELFEEVARGIVVEVGKKT